MIYAEAAFFDRAPVAHCAAREDFQRLRQIDRRNAAANRGAFCRGNRTWA